MRPSRLRGTPGETAFARVQTLRRQLADAQLNFTDRHPEIVRLKDELATAEKDAAAERTPSGVRPRSHSQCGAGVPPAAERS